MALYIDKAAITVNAIMAGGAAMAAIFGVGGTTTLVLYAVLVWCKPPQALDNDTMWGYLGRYGVTGKRIWLAVTTVTAASVLTVYYYAVFTAETTHWLAIAGTAVFMTGAVGWPVAVALGLFRWSAVAVVCTQIGTTAMLVWATAVEAAPVWVVLAASMAVFHHVVIDGLWVVLTPAGTAMVTESLLQ